MAVYVAEHEECKVRILGGRAWERTRFGPPMGGQGLPAQMPGSSAFLQDLPEQSQLLPGLLSDFSSCPKKVPVALLKSLPLLFSDALFLFASQHFSRFIITRRFFCLLNVCLPFQDTGGQESQCLE